MANLRQHGMSILGVAVVCAIGFGLPSGARVTATDTVKEEKTAVDPVAKTAVGGNDAPVTTAIRKQEAQHQEAIANDCVK
jgi:hypothetical protein